MTLKKIWSFLALLASLFLTSSLVWAQHHEAVPGVKPGIELSPKTYLVLVLMAGVVFVSSLWVLWDAKRLGLGQEKIDGNKSLGPWGWFGVTLGLWLLAFPLYLWTRGKPKC